MITLEIHKNSITALHTDAVVNAANKELHSGSGVCGAIFACAGSEALAAECAKFGGCSTGSAVITSACGMPNAKYIIHAVGPRYYGGLHGEQFLLGSCYKKALELARDSGCRSVAFPLISAGIFGYPEREAWIVALHTCLDFIDANPDTDMAIVFVRQHRDQVDLGKQILSEVLAARS